ncbi:hypothetical protein DPMN_079848 [Dreissena polymorpha]|uniref:Uncharacterized protein n=1 Tax=Dreissena polymorpha TaxID=45954 RepID=A0A9D3YQA2_DREPO|nr:hypothetical protein DPMN_079848 [Dreissena polymorpha]
MEETYSTLTSRRLPVGLIYVLRDIFSWPLSDEQELSPGIPKDHVEDVAVTFTLIPVDSQKGKDLLRILISLAGTLSTSGLLKRCSTFYRPVVPKRPEEVEMNE